MQIEVGKTYRARNGSKVGPMQPAQSEGYDFYGSDGENDRVFQKDGRHGASNIRPDPTMDLIAEWTDGPVRTVTRREVVAGSYGRVRVGRVVDVPDCNNPDVPHASRVSLAMDDAEYTAAELKAAAAVLLELAGALE